jgi:hypothetical protein
MHFSYARIEYTQLILYGVKLKLPPTFVSKVGALPTICSSNFIFSHSSATMLAPVKYIHSIPLQLTRYIDQSYIKKIIKSPRVFD